MDHYTLERGLTIWWKLQYKGGGCIRLENGMCEEHACQHGNNDPERVHSPNDRPGVRAKECQTKYNVDWEARRAVRTRSRRLAIVRVAYIAGTAHPKPRIIGMNDLPCRPTTRMKRSMTN